MSLINRESQHTGEVDELINPGERPHAGKQTDLTVD